MSSNELVPSISIANLLNQRAAVMARLEEAAGLIREAHRIAVEARLGMPRVTVCAKYSRGSDERNIAGARINLHSRDGSTHDQDAHPEGEISRVFQVGVDASGWQYLMHESGLRSLMDAAAREKWDRAIQAGEIPELTEANVRSTFEALHASRAEMFERGVIACFKALSWRFRTNQPQKFGRRIVVSGLTGTYGHHKADELDDLQRVMHVLDGRPEPDYRGSTLALLTAAGLRGYPNRAGQCETEYLAIRTFMNGNGHVTFKRQDLVDKLNLIIAKHYPGALPAPR